MGKNLVDLRFAVGDGQGAQSQPWRLWVTRLGDIYLAHRSSAKIEKLSFHRSGICRHAFTTEFGTPATMDDRKMSRWLRASVPSRGSLECVPLAFIAIPTDYLPEVRSPLKAGDALAVAAPAHGACQFMLGITAEDEPTIRGAYGGPPNFNVVLAAPLPDGTLLFLGWHHMPDWQNVDVNVPPYGNKSAIVFHADDPGPGRRIHLLMHQPPKDYSAISFTELSGYVKPIE